MKRSFRSTFAVLVLLVAGCGEGGKEAAIDQAPPPNPPRPAEAIDRTVPRFLQALESGDCARLFRYMPHSSQRPRRIRDTPPSKEECAELERRAKQFPDGFEPMASRTFTTAAVVDGTAGEQEDTMLWALDRGGRWKFLLGLPGDEQVGTEPRDAQEMRANVATWMQAVRDRDCAGIWRGFQRDSGFVTRRGGDRRRLCEELPAGYRTPGPLRAIAQNPSVRPAKLGETRNFGFYGLDFPDGRFVTLIAATELTSGEPGSEHADPGVYAYLVAREPRAPNK